MAQQTLILVKPDGVQRGLVGEILRRIESKGYRITRMRMLTATDEQLASHYHEHTAKPFYPGMAEYMKSGPIVAAVVEGNRVIEGVRSLSGATDPTSAAPGTIRGDLGRDWGDGQIRNLIHSSDGEESAAHEIGVWFSE
ncbi:nucleoside-diphosphate kinase [Trueperella bialowiezensis]|uniref:Nucleoside diphosphate kinase n=1 Tax=Trueperella bialowiezensis TaxID=312285 RepID=A0A3S4VF04_9ACTO|nr:nucleoside-diphosphate kinase [Trueperella bialowiezensis]VEI12703.1 Nucleoside diphosphate kinase [Trueperella bialowiezensis]